MWNLPCELKLLTLDEALARGPCEGGRKEGRKEHAFSRGPWLHLGRDSERTSVFAVRHFGFGRHFSAFIQRRRRREVGSVGFRVFAFRRIARRELPLPPIRTFINRAHFRHPLYLSRYFEYFGLSLSLARSLLYLLIFGFSKIRPESRRCGYSCT